MLPLLATRRTATAVLLLALAGALHTALRGRPLHLAVDVLGTSVGLRLDLTATLLAGFVGALAWVVAGYSHTNLAGQPGGTRLARAATTAVLALVLLVAGASLPVMALGWTVSGLAAARMIAHPGTPAAGRSAATARRTLLWGDLALWSLVLVAAVRLPDLDRAGLPAAMASTDALTAAVLGGLVVVASVVRSALVPAHTWLLESTEAPSPVSAFLHAGIVNGGGLLLVLLWPLTSAWGPALVALVVLGCVSVVLGTWAGRARDDVKGRLVCSTTTQMGFVSVQVGLGMPAAALLHVVGHGSWKSWLFLRAAGAADRLRAPGHAPRHRDPLTTWTPLLLGGLLGAPAAATMLADRGPVALVPVALVTALAITSGRELAALADVTAPTRAAAAALAGTTAAGALWALDLWKAWAAPLLSAQAQTWSGPSAWALVLGVAASAAATLAGLHLLERDPTGPLAVALLPAALSPGLRRRARATWPAVAAPPSAKRAVQADDVLLASRVAARVVGPAWPLHSAVAVNPLAPLESLPFDEVVELARRTHGAELLPSLEWFHDRWAAGRITPAGLLRALADAEGPDAAALPADVATFVPNSSALPTQPRHEPGSVPAGSTPRLCEALEPRGTRQRVTARVDQESGWWCQRAWADSTGTGPGPYRRWHRAASRPGYARASGLTGVTALVRDLPADPAAAVAVLVRATGLPGTALVGYLTRSVASAPGWSAHAQWRAGRGQGDAVVELLALRMALDLLHTGAAGGRDLDLSPAAAYDDCGTQVGDLYRRTWQRALDLSVAERLLPALVHAERAGEETGPAARRRAPSQSVWCIDVRSERVRRHLEASGRHETFGFAGFFGVATRHTSADGGSSDQCPVLIAPSSASHTPAGPLGLAQVLHRLSTGANRAPLVPLVTAEVFGLLAAGVSAAATLAPARARRLRSAWTGRTAAAPPTWLVDLDTRVSTAEAVLRGIGLVEGFAPVLAVVGHGASTENNAHAATYQCGACGASSGLVNARLLVDALNDPQVRAGLRERGIDLPDDTVAVAALHDTATDEVGLVVDPAVGPVASPAVDAVAEALAQAGRRTALERVRGLPRAERVDGGDPADTRTAMRDVARRASSWAEPTPEWGLAGNQAIVVGPRRLTAGLDLGGRVFLQSYERDLDTDDRVLEQLMTAPVVVSQWISAQYHLSSVAPEVFGAGDKTTLNVVGDVGVLSGAHGDLRLGLPWQSLFTAPPTGPGRQPGAHEPARHLVVVAAGRESVRAVVARHDVLRQLVSHGWSQVVVVDDGAHALLPDLTWRTWVPARPGRAAGQGLGMRG
ncbi:MAG: putative inorganic carbon transporter subunit DabA [Nocardioides marinisabuli]|uniref:putative inorganic carbon transporter subunit DabA n=1 Tax=Nocardioides marinisabuli TaxID=419476 RepID=UPI003219912F